jgi:hypothetical protein
MDSTHPVAMTNAHKSILRRLILLINFFILFPVYLVSLPRLKSPEVAGSSQLIEYFFFTRYLSVVSGGAITGRMFFL